MTFQRLLWSRRQGGASLIEVLVSIVIASIGLLALAGINAASLRYGKMSQYKAVGTLLANDIVDRMRANGVSATATVTAYSYEIDFATQTGAAPAAPGNLCNTAASVCTVAEIAAADLYQWRLNVRDSLPSGSVFLKPDPAITTAMDLWVVWREASTAADEIVKTGGDRECPNDLAVPDDAVRCVYFRVRL